MARVLILGQGAIGSFFGAATGTVHEVQHLVRPPGPKRARLSRAFNDRRARRFRQKGDYIFSCNTDPACAQSADLVILPVSHRSLHDAVETLAPHLTPDQTVVIAGNVWDDFNWLKTALPCPHVFAFPNFGGAVVQGALTGWMTGRLTTGVTDPRHAPALDRAEALFTAAGFTCTRQADIAGWLAVHFALNAGMLACARAQGGFERMARNPSRLRDMYAMIREAMTVPPLLGHDPAAFPEGRAASRPLWPRALGSWLIFHLPGIARAADAGRNDEEWHSFAARLVETGQTAGLPLPRLTAALG